MTLERGGQYDNSQSFFSVNPDELSILEFAQSHDFKIHQKSKRFLTIMSLGSPEKYEDLGVVHTNLGGYPMTVSAKRKQGIQTGVLYVKCNMKAFKNYLLSLGKDIKKYIEFDERFIKAGLESIVYARRVLNVEETNQLIITINENAQSD